MQRQSSITSTTNFQNHEVGKRTKNDSCFYCSDSGHITKSCHHGKSLQCKLSGQWGHKSKQHDQNHHQEDGNDESAKDDAPYSDPSILLDNTLIHSTIDVPLLIMTL